MFKAQDRALGDNIIREAFKAVLDDTAISINVNWLRLPVLPMNIGEDEGVVTIDLMVIIHDIELDSEVGMSDILEIIRVQRIVAKLARTSGAVVTGVTGIAVASHGDVLIPQAINILMVHSCKLLDRGTSSVSRAHSIRGYGTRSTLASRAIIPLKTLALASAAVADTLIRAFTIVVSSVTQDPSRRILHGRELLGGTLGVHIAVNNDLGIGSGETSRGGVQITQRGVDVSITERADAL